MNDPNYARIDRIEIFKPRSRKPWQIISAQEMGGWKEIFFDECVKGPRTVDIDFDGHLDLKLFDCGGNGASYADYFLYRPETGRFVWEPALSDLSEIGVDPKTKTLYAHRSEGVGNTTDETYEWSGRRLVLDSRETSSDAPDPNDRTTIHDSTIIHDRPIIHERWVRQGNQLVRVLHEKTPQ